MMKILLKYVFSISALTVATLLVMFVLAIAANASKQENEIAEFAVLDKVTARTSHLEIHIGETKRFGTFSITPRICYTRTAVEPPWTTAFVEVDETELNGEKQRIFTGWMFAHSPGLNSVEHPVYDVWLIDCSSKSSAHG